MDAFHNLLREATNPRNATVGHTTNSTQNGTTNHGAQGTKGGSMGIPMGMNINLPLGNYRNGTNLNSLQHRGSSSSQLYSSSVGLNDSSFDGGNNGSGAASNSLSATSSPTASAKSSSKKRKASEEVPLNDDSGDDGKDEPTDPKAKRRAQIAKAARKHRQRQKDELIALRAKVKDLKEQIEVLQSAEPSEHNTEQGWRQEAEQHAEIRARVDQENDFLRKTIMEQMKFIQRLQDYFTKQPLLNIPSLDTILNTSATTANRDALLPSSSGMMPSLSAANIGSISALAGGNAQALSLQGQMPQFQLPNSNAVSGLLQNNRALRVNPFHDELRRLAGDAMSAADAQLTDCEERFLNPRTTTMKYFDMDLQFEMVSTEMGVFLRHFIHGFDANTLLEHLWTSIGNANFETKCLPFVDSVEVVENLDMDVKYVRRVVNLTVANNSTDRSAQTVPEVRLEINQRRRNMDGSILCVSKSVRTDPSYPKSYDYIARDQSTVISIRNFSDSTGSGCVLLWSVKVVIDKEKEAQSKESNIPDIVMKNLFETTPVLVKAIVDQGLAQAL